MHVPPSPHSLLSLPAAMLTGGLACIPARAGSKGIAHKNIQDLGGKPLLAYSIERAWQTPGVSRVIVSTDSPVIRDIAIKWGAEVPFLRPESLAGDKADLAEATRHTLAELQRTGYQPNFLITLLPTHPFRTRSLMQRTVEKLSQGFHEFLTVRPIAAHQYRFATMAADGRMRPLAKELFRKTYYRPYGLVHAVRLDLRFHKALYLEHVTDPVMLIDIDTPDDLERARTVLRERRFCFE